MSFTDDLFYSAPASKPTNSPDKVPTRWIISPADVLNGADPADYNCPRSSSIFIAFAITNILVSLLSVVAGYRPVQYIMTCHLVGKPNKKNTIQYAWILPLITQFLGNAILGAIIHNTPGYNNVSVGDVVMIYLIRPRIALIFLWTITALIRVHGEYAWLSALIGNAVAEIILQIAADIYLIVSGYKFYGNWSSVLGIMIFMCITTGLAAIGVARILFASRAMDATGNDLSVTEYNGRRLSHSLGNRMKHWVFVMAFIVWSYLLSWLFFAAVVLWGEEHSV